MQCNQKYVSESFSVVKLRISPAYQTTKRCGGKELYRAHAQVRRGSRAASRSHSTLRSGTRRRDLKILPAKPAADLRAGCRRERAGVMASVDRDAFMLRLERLYGSWEVGAGRGSRPEWAGSNWTRAMCSRGCIPRTTQWYGCQLLR